VVWCGHFSQEIERPDLIWEWWTLAGCPHPGHLNGIFGPIADHTYPKTVNEPANCRFMFHLRVSRPPLPRHPFRIHLQHGRKDGGYQARQIRISETI